MRIQSVHLKLYKRFTDLLISNIPASARLVVLIGPNGTGKSSVFDALLLKSQGAKTNYSLDGGKRDYYHKDDYTSTQPGTTREVWERVHVQFHSVEPTRDKWSAAFNIRSPYRNEADFHLTSLQSSDPSTETARFERIIDQDQAVSDNYRRLSWRRMADLDRDAPGATRFDQYRKESLGELQTAMGNLFAGPPLELQDFGGLRDSGVFRFSKGTVTDFHYKNLSGGEKAAFDLLLDIFVKRSEYQDAIYCIDEPEAHVATALHGPLLDALLDLIPNESQLWIATHSIGFVRKAYEMMRRDNNVAFLDFSRQDFDSAVEITPRIPDRSFWQTVYQVALDDLADLVAPANIVICEGSSTKVDKGFDADCYNRIFADSQPETLFISYGGSTQVEKSEDLIAVLRAITKGVNVSRLIDRDDMTPDAREEKIENGISVLAQREIENYLYDPEVLRTFLKVNGREEMAESIFEHRAQLLANSTSTGDDVKKITQNLFDHIRKSTGLQFLGNSRKEFALQHLVPSLKQTPCVFQELYKDVFL